MNMLNRTSAWLLAIAITSLALSGCAAKGPRNQARVSALGVVDAAVEVSQRESDLYAANVYSAPKHAELVDLKLKVLYAARAYERAARAIPAEGASMPVALETARANVLAAIADLEHAIPAMSGTTAAIQAALSALRAALEGSIASRRRLPSPLHSGLPGGGVLAIFAMAQLFAKLLVSGRTTYEKLRVLLKKEGATDEELDAADLKVTTEIERVEAEKRGAGGTVGGPSQPQDDGA